MVAITRTQRNKSIISIHFYKQRFDRVASDLLSFY